MAKEITWDHKYFYGVEIPEHDYEMGYISYWTLAQPFDAILCNEIASRDFDELEIENGADYDEDTGEWKEIFQYYIISGSFAEMLKDLTDEIVYYDNALNIYVWGVTHFGTAWDYVATDIKLISTEER